MSDLTVSSAAASRAAVSRAAATSKPPCILYVEDDVDHAELVLRSLAQRTQRAGVVHVGDGAAALDYLERSERAEVPRPQLILLDLRLPKVDGLDVLRTVKATPALAAIPIVILTTSANGADISCAYAHHANSYLVKPHDFATLEAMVQELGDHWLVLSSSADGEH